MTSIANNLKASLASLDVGMPPSLSDLTNGGPLSPSDDEVVEKNLAALDKELNSKLSISTEEASRAQQDPLVHDAAANSNLAKSGADPNFSNDPLSATALTSPLHTLNWDAIVTAQGGSLSGIVNNDSAAANGSAVGNFDNFKRSGPHFPPSLEKLIMDYHHRHSKSWQLAHDMGAGSGVYAATMARYFRHVHVSDPSASGSTISRRSLSNWAAANKKSRGRFTFSTQIPERGHESIADGTADMALVIGGAHLASDPTALVLSAAESLSPGGTLALVAYSPVCRVTGNPGADAAVQRLFAAWGPAAWDVVCGADAKGKQRFSLGLDFVPIPEHIFALDKTRRISINNPGGAGFAVPGFKAEGSESRVRNGERRHEYTSEEDQAKGWRQEVGPEFFRSLTTALLGSAKAAQFEQNFKEIADVVHETSTNGIMVDVDWSVAVVLATKK